MTGVTSPFLRRSNLDGNASVPVRSQTMPSSTAHSGTDAASARATPPGAITSESAIASEVIIAIGFCVLRRFFTWLSPFDVWRGDNPHQPASTTTHIITIVVASRLETRFARGVLPFEQKGCSFSSNLLQKKGQILQERRSEADVPGHFSEIAGTQPVCLQFRTYSGRFWPLCFRGCRQSWFVPAVSALQFRLAREE